jgi:acyl-coenzyme A synthetase/AMP-(fatty) acid ligase
VVGFPHEIKGEGIGCYVILRQGVTTDAALTAYVLCMPACAVGSLCVHC